jgi:hypothetical protein
MSSMFAAQLCRTTTATRCFLSKAAKGVEPPDPAVVPDHLDVLADPDVPGQANLPGRLPCVVARDVRVLKVRPDRGRARPEVGGQKRQHVVGRGSDRTGAGKWWQRPAPRFE